MRYRSLVVFPLLWSAAFLLGDALLHGTPRYPVFLRTEVELVKGLALAGSLAAALALEPGDYLRRAWLFIAGCMALLLLRDLTLAPLGLESMGARNLDLLRGLLVVAANVSQVVGTWMLARAGERAGLGVPVSSRAQWGVLALAVGLAAAFAGPGIVTSARRVMDGDLLALTSAASALGDMVSLCLIAPLLLTALALRGGLIGWTWTLLTVSYVAWLLYDVLLVLGPWLGLGPRGVRTGSELFRALGCSFGFTAGLAQRAVVEQLKKMGRTRPAPG
jgi:hypothetical protein